MATIVPVAYRQRRFQRVGEWLPKKPQILIDWVRQLVEEVDRKKRLRRRAEAEIWPEPVMELNNLIESTAELRMLASSMFDEVPDKDPYRQDPIGNKQIKSYKHMLETFAYIINQNIAPSWSMTAYGVGLIGFPFNAILDWPMATQSGYAFFLKAEVNECIKNILNLWRDQVLMTNKSQYVITTGENGWLSTEALQTIESDTNADDQTYTFQQLFKCDPENDPEHWGFQSWDSFFIREFNDFDTLRPVAFPNNPRWIASSCESKPFSLQTNVEEYDSFWLKGQAYSVAEMLDHSTDADFFIGGTVYQAFLSATSYHRWNSPVDGEVLSSKIVNGTYFSEPTITGFTNPEGPDPASPDKAQGYITHVATRAIFMIKAPEPVGLVGVIYVGMADVSTCEINERLQDNFPQSVKKGEEIGMFHHGGSTYCLLFQKGVKLAWVTGASPSTATRNVHVRSPLAYVYEGAEE